VVLPSLWFDAVMLPHVCAARFALENCIFLILLFSTDNTTRYDAYNIRRLYVWSIFNRDVLGKFVCRD